MYSHISKPGAIIIWLLFIGFCVACSGKKDSESEAKDAELQTDQKKLTAVKANAVLSRIIAVYSITKPSRLAADYNLGYTLFVVSTSGVLLTADASTMYDYRVIWENTHLKNFSDSGAVVDFGEAVNLNSVADTIALGQVMISSRPGVLANVPFVFPKGSEADFPARIICETLLADSAGIVCALGFSSKLRKNEQ